MIVADNPLVLFLLSVLWVPSVLGLVYLWAVYISVRAYGNQWLLQMLCITSVPTTLTMMYVSFATFRRLDDDPLPNSVAALAGVVLVFGLSWVVPYKAVRIYLTTHGRTTQPEVPVTNGKHSGA